MVSASGLNLNAAIPDPSSFVFTSFSCHIL